MNLAYRTVEHDLLGGTITGPWISYPITLELTASQATISGLALTDVTGAAGPPPVTSDTTVAGTVVGALAGDAPEVQFQYNDDGQIDDLTTAAADGTFQETLPGLGYGNVTVMARAVEWDAADGVFLYGDWATLAFDHEPAAPPAVATLALANITDTATDANGNPMTSDASIKGTLAAAAVGQLLDIEIDTNGDGVPDDRTQVGQAFQPDGSADSLSDPSQAGKPDLQFSFTPVGLGYGGVTVAVRVVAPGADGTLARGAWTSLSFTFEAPPVAAPVVMDLALANDDGSSPTDSVTSDPTLTGQVTFANLLNSDGTAPPIPADPTAGAAPNDPAFLTVQFDTNGDGVPDASTTTGAGGTFTFKPTGLAAGQVTVLARAIGRESNLDYGNWTSLTFTYQPAAASAPGVGQLTLANPLSGATTLTATIPRSPGRSSSPAATQTSLPAP